MSPLRIVFLGLSITSSWGNGHATTYRALVRELHARGHEVLFLERDMPWYQANRDLPHPPYGRTCLYSGLDELRDRHTDALREADLAVVGSYVPEGARVGEWVTATARGVRAFYDIDTPVTLAKLQHGDLEYLSRALIPRYDLYLSFTGGPTLERLEREYGAAQARPLYCAVDPATYYSEPCTEEWDLGYLGTYAADRQPALECLLVEPARGWPAGRFVVAGPQYPPSIRWPANVTRVEHLAPAEHRSFYNAQRWTLNVTRADMVRAGYSPSVRIMEAAACATPIISDYWPGLETLLEPGREVLIPRGAQEVLDAVRNTPERERIAIGRRARARILAEHTAGRRAEQLESYVRPLLERRCAPAARHA
jgi:spore maturation protein CgeB